LEKEVFWHGCGSLKRLKELEAENAQLKRMFADVSLQRDALKDLIEKKF
jgi:putative transposase